MAVEVDSNFTSAQYSTVQYNKRITKHNDSSLRKHERARPLPIVPIYLHGSTATLPCTCQHDYGCHHAHADQRTSVAHCLQRELGRLYEPHAPLGESHIVGRGDDSIGDGHTSILPYIQIIHEFHRSHTPLPLAHLAHTGVHAVDDQCMVSRCADATCTQHLAPQMGPMLQFDAMQMFHRDTALVHNRCRRRRARFHHVASFTAAENG